VRVLLIEEDDAIAALIAALLVAAGCGVTRARRPAEGLVLAARGRYDAVLTDPFGSSYDAPAPGRPGRAAGAGGPRADRAGDRPRLGARRRCGGAGRLRGRAQALRPGPPARRPPPRRPPAAAAVTPRAVLRRSGTATSWRSTGPARPTSGCTTRSSPR
jgi:hypothetical protein